MPLVHEISINFPEELYPGGFESFEYYVLLHEELFYDYRQPPDFRELYTSLQQRIKAFPAHRIKRGVQQQDADMMLEHCIRTLSFCEIDITTRVAGELSEFLRLLCGLVKVNGPNQDDEFDNIKNHSYHNQLRAFAANAYHYFYAYWLVPPSAAVQSPDIIYNAAFSANVCAKSGFVPPVAINLARWLATTKARTGVDLRATQKFKELKPLWDAYEEYLTRLQKQELARLLKVAPRPNWYRCANDGCDIQAMSRGALRRCAGGCPADEKPHYCSEFCQRRHWTIHREFCRTGSANPHPGIMKDDGDPAWLDVGAFRPRVIPDKEHEHDWPLFAEREGAEIFVDIAHDSPYRKGDIFRIRTRTLSPACLKAYKRLWTSELPAAARKLIDGGLLDPPDNMGFPRRPT